MTPLDKISFYLQAALDKCRSKDCRQISDALRPILPELCAALQGVVTSPESTAAQKLQASSILMAAWQRCLQAEGKNKAEETKRVRARANKPITDEEVQARFNQLLRNLDDTESDILFAKLQRAYDKKKRGI